MAEPAAKILHRISFVVPALNEETVVGIVARDIHNHVDRAVATYELILIDDGSSDRTGEIMEALARDLPNVRVLHNKPNIGLGASYQRGVAESRYDYVMMLCGDGGLPASSLPPIIEKIGAADIVIPYITNLRSIKTPLRYMISRSYTRVLNLLSGQNLHYYNGLPVHRRQLLTASIMTSSGFGFQGEILVKLLKLGHSYVEVGVLGSETTNKTSVFRVKNLASVTRTVFKLIKLVVRLSLYKTTTAENSDEC
ncbi:MAG TPA: glycosyltransferase family 2 protein [Xanthobacteraceae bacterium]|jgi:glycosyltransferase involved in cell wall biosynthesis